MTLAARRRVLTRPAVLAATAIVALLLAIVIGMPGVSLERILADPDGLEGRIFLQLQLPRVALGFATGMVLSVAGLLMQAILRNPLADPYILGVSGGAAVGSAFAAMVGLGLGPLLGPLGGFVGALLAFSLVAYFGRGGGQEAPLRMLLAGVVVNSLAGAGLMIFAALGDSGDVQRTLVRLMGSLGVDPRFPWLAPLVVVVGVVTVIAVFPFRRALDLLALGDDTATSLGVDAGKLRKKLLVLLSLGVGAVVAATGLLGFVGLVVPHGLRLVLGPVHRYLLPVSAIVGGSVVVLADAGVSRLTDTFGTEIPVGVVMALLGGPLFLWLLLKGFRRGGVA